MFGYSGVLNFEIRVFNFVTYLDVVTCFSHFFFSSLYHVFILLWEFISQIHSAFG
jgi:hypothetical protein